MPNGACLCGQIRYEIAGGARFMYQCHCGKCRAASGASFVTNMIVDADRFAITAGKERLSAYESSPNKRRYFCSVCGSPIYSQAEDTKRFVSVRCGTLTQDPGLRVAYHAFVSWKAAWVDIRDDAPQFSEWPDPDLLKQLLDEREGARGGASVRIGPRPDAASRRDWTPGSCITEESIMKPRITVLTLGVDDLERAVRFYSEGLGFHTDGIVGREFEFGAVAFFDMQPGLRLALWPRRSLAHDSGLEDPGPGLGSLSMGHNAGYFQHPDRHLWEVVWNPQWQDRDR